MKENDFNTLHDREMVCEDCGQSYILEAGEQAFFIRKGLSLPRRCKPCRIMRKLQSAPIVHKEGVDNA